MCDYDKRTALHLAASEGHTELVKFLVKTTVLLSTFLLAQINVGHVQVDPRDRWNRTPRDDADTFGYRDIVQLLDKAQQKVSKQKHKQRKIYFYLREKRPNPKCLLLQTIKTNCASEEAPTHQAGDDSIQYQPKRRKKKNHRMKSTLFVKM